MNTLTHNDKTIPMQRQLVGALTQHLQLPVGIFGTAFVETPSDKAYQDSIAKWWETLTPKARYPLSLLNTLAAPTAVIDLRAMLGQRSLIQSSALAGGLESSAPWLLVGYNESKDELQIRPLDTKRDLLNTLQTWLQTDAISFVPEMKFEVSLEEFCTLLALCDLYTRTLYSAYLTHSAVPENHSIDHILKTYQESVQIQDPRWLLSFCLPLVPNSARSLEPEKVRQCIGQLIKKGLLQQTSAASEVTLTTPGLFLAEALHRRSSLVGLNIAGADTAGKIGTHAGLLVRSDESIWYCDIGSGQNITVLALSAENTREILEALLTPAGIPPLKTESPSQPPDTFPAFIAPPPAPPKRETAAPRATPPVCSKCGFPLTKATAKFCGHCGAPL